MAAITRIATPNVSSKKVSWRFQVAQSREMIDTQIRQLRATLFWSFLALGVGLLILAALQTFYLAADKELAVAPRSGRASGRG